MHWVARPTGVKIQLRAGEMAQSIQCLTAQSWVPKFKPPESRPTHKETWSQCVTILVLQRQRQNTWGLCLLASQTSQITSLQIQDRPSFKESGRDREMAGWLRMHTALPENLTSIPITHVGWLTNCCNFSSKGFHGFWPMAPASYAQTHLHTHTHT